MEEFADPRDSHAREEERIRPWLKRSGKWEFRGWGKVGTLTGTCFLAERGYAPRASQRRTPLLYPPAADSSLSMFGRHFSWERL